MRYCEDYVITCAIDVWRGNETARVDYRRGEISGVTVGGIDAPERLAEVMQWASGNYRLNVPNSLPASLPKRGGAAPFEAVPAPPRARPRVPGDAAARPGDATDGAARPSLRRRAQSAPAPRAPPRAPVAATMHAHDFGMPAPRHRRPEGGRRARGRRPPVGGFARLGGGAR